MESFFVSSEDCLIVKAFYRTSSLREAAKALKRDPAWLVRQAQRISREHDLFCKVNGKWQVTERGQSLLAWMEESIQSQKKALDSKRSLKIAATTWFSEEMLIPAIRDLRKMLPNVDEVLISQSEDFEKTLKNGEVDFVVACHPPENPVIAHKKVLPEKWITAVPGAWLSQMKGRSFEMTRFLSGKPYIRHGQLNPDSLYPGMKSMAPNVSLTVNHLVGVRSAIIHGLGWSCVPEFLVRSALQAKDIADAGLPVAMNHHVCVWWLRERRESKKLSESMSAWVSGISKTPA